MKKLTEKRKQALLDAVIKMVSAEIWEDDFTILEELLKFIPLTNLLQSLPEEQWKEFPEIEVKQADHEKDAKKLYEKSGMQAVYKYADNLGLPYGYCQGCETETPVHNGSCLVCGSSVRK